MKERQPRNDCQICLYPWRTQPYTVSCCGWVVYFAADEKAANDGHRLLHDGWVGYGPLPVKYGRPGRGSVLEVLLRKHRLKLQEGPSGE